MITNMIVGMAAIPVLEVGGTHVSAALVEPDGWRVHSMTRHELDADAPADVLIGRFREAASTLDAPAGTHWGLAMPDPFDYDRGIALFEGVGKFEALRGVDLRSALRHGLRGEISFVNDADAFLLGEWTNGAAAGAHRCAGLTLGTGVGSAWLVGGEVVDPGLPPGGRIHRLDPAGVPLEDIVSRRAMRRAFVAGGGDPAADVRDIAMRARAGSPLARQVLATAMAALGRVAGRCLAGFGADVLVIGGSMSASWDVLAPAFRAGALGTGLPEVRVASDAPGAPFIGAALHALRRSRA